LNVESIDLQKQQRFTKQTDFLNTDSTIAETHEKNKAFIKVFYFFDFYNQLRL